MPARALIQVKKDIEASLYKLLTFLKIGDLEPEISAIVFQALRELAANAVEHSGADQFLTGLTVFAEPGQSRRPKYRQLQPGGRHHYDLLAADFGCGILQSIRRKLGLQTSAEDYMRNTPWSNGMAELLTAEQRTIASTFSGNLILRRGRKSQGLHDLFEVVSSFNGTLTLRTGRTVSFVSANGCGEPSVEFHDTSKGRDLFLPGTVLSALLPSRRLGVLQADTRALKARRPSDKAQLVVCQLEEKPTRLLQGGPIEGLRRPAERDADRIRREAHKWSPETALELDLGVARQLDVEYLDALFQELIKREGDEDYYILGRLLVTNVPMQAIHALQRGVAEAFLQNLGLYVLLLDVNDEPVFLGFDRPLEGALKWEDLAQVIVRCGLVFDKDLKRVLGLKSLKAVEEFGEVLKSHRGGLLRRTNSPSPGFQCPSLKEPLHSRRSDLKKEIIRHAVKEPGLSCFCLRNGRSVTSLVDFCQLWSAPNLVTDGVKLLLSELPRRPWDTVCGFRNNGDRLASRLARMLHIENLSILTLESEHVPNNIGAAVLVVCDVIFDGDENSQLAKWVAVISDRVSKLGGEWSFAAFLDLRIEEDGRPEWLRDAAFAESVLKRTSFDEAAQVELPRPAGLSPFHRGFRHGPNYALSKPKYTGRQGCVDPGLSPAETSAEFWHLATEAGFLSCTREAREQRELVFSDFTERLLESRHTRRLVDKFVAEFVRRTLRGRVHVILHPVHPVGAYLAQLAAESLQTRPLVLPVHQQRYGGNLEVSSSDWAFAKAKLVDFDSTEEGNLGALVIDDSVITGRSLVFMAGLASRLGLNVVGGLVLIDRLAPETRAGVEMVTGELASLS